MNESLHWYENEDQVKHVSRCMRECILSKITMKGGA